MTRRVRVPVVTALLLAGSVVAAAPASAVIGGSTSTYGPWAVRMLIDGKPACTGTAITRRWILTASHCFYEQALPIRDKRISFRVGALDMRKGVTVRPAGKRVGSAHADMMLIKVAPMNVPTARLATTHVRRGQLVRQYGWGATCAAEDENACQSPVLKQSTLRVVRPDDPRCKGYTAPGGPDFCMEKVAGIPAGGDSGGPVMSIGPRGTETLLGVFDGSDRERTAEAGEIVQQLAWIRSVVRG